MPHVGEAHDTGQGQQQETKEHITSHMGVLTATFYGGNSARSTLFSYILQRTGRFAGPGPKNQH